MKNIILSISFLLGGLAIFVFGSPYYKVFPTNQNQTYNLILTSLFLLVALGLKKSTSLSRYWSSAYALFVAAAALLFLSTGILNISIDAPNPLQNIALDKISQFFHIVPVILGLTWLVKDDNKSIFIQRGNLKRGLIFGLISFFLFATLAIVTQLPRSAFFSSLSAAIPWVLLFIFANSIMEELWFRAIFLRKYEAVIGRKAAIFVTAAVFGASHISATYDFPGGGVVFGLVVFGLGIVGAYAMLKDDGLLGPILFHAGYDLLVIVPIINSL